MLYCNCLVVKGHNHKHDLATCPGHIQGKSWIDSELHLTINPPLQGTYAANATVYLNIIPRY